MNDAPIQSTADRQTFIGGSDAAAVLGLSPWRTPLQVYLQKIGEAPPPDDSDRKRERILARGKREEPHIIDDVIALCGVTVTRRSAADRPNYHRDGEHGFLAAEIDFEWLVTPEIVERLAHERGIQIDPTLIGTVQNGEVKTAHPFVAMHKFGEEGTDEIPIEYYCQALHGLGVSRRQVTLVALGVYVDDPILYLVSRDEQSLAAMRERLVRFWTDNVLKRVPPPITNAADGYRLLKRRLATRLEATPDVAAMVQTYRHISGKISSYEDARETVKIEILEAILGADALENPGAKDRGKHVITADGKTIATIAYQEQERIDVDMLRTEYPDAAAACASLSAFYKFNLPRSKA
jgi:predicted phage-related endonuclease